MKNYKIEISNYQAKPRVHVEKYSETMVLTQSLTYKCADEQEAASTVVAILMKIEAEQ